MTEGRKGDAGKAPWDLLPWGAVQVVVEVLEHGRTEYDADNWRLVKEPRRRYFAAACRHVVAWRRGEKLDPKSGLPHLAHAACDILFLLELEVGLGPTSAEMDQEHDDFVKLSEQLPEWADEAKALGLTCVLGQPALFRDNVTGEIVNYLDYLKVVSPGWTGLLQISKHDLQRFSLWCEGRRHAK